MDKYSISRRAFMRVLGMGAVGISATSGLASTLNPLKDLGKKKLSKEEKFLTYDPGKMTHTYCEMCFWNCGVNVYTRNKKVFHLEGNVKNPNNNGRLCAKGNSGIGQLYDPNRLKFPMIRTGKRGEGKWQRVTWGEAFEYINNKLKNIIKQYGVNAVGSAPHCTGTGIFRDLIWALGSTSVALPDWSQCLGAREIAWQLTYGNEPTDHEPWDFENSKCMVLFGRDMIGAIHTGQTAAFNNAISTGAKLIVVDPRLSPTAARADYWLQIKPGTDTALVLSMIHILIRDNLVNKEFIEKYCYGYEKLVGHVKQYTPEWAAKECEIPVKTIEKVTQEFAKAAPHAVAISSRRTSRYGNDTQWVRSIAILNALIGNYGIQGGIAELGKFKLNLKEDELKPKYPGGERYDKVGTRHLGNVGFGNINAFIEATRTGKPYPIKAWINWGSNLIGGSSLGDIKRLHEVIENLDLIVSIDVIPNDMVYYSDVVLPSSTYLERYDTPYTKEGIYPFIALREPAIDPLYDTKDAWEIAYNIAKPLGIGAYFKKSAKERVDEILNSFEPEQRETLIKEGVLVDKTHDPFPQASGKKLKFNTPTGKIELYSTELEKLEKEYGKSHSPLPHYTPPNEPEEGTFRFLIGRPSVHSHARSQNIEVLAELSSSPKDLGVWMHPEDAEKLALKDGDKVIIHSVNNGSKSKPTTLKVTNRIKRRNVFVMHGFGHISPMLKVAYNKGVNDAMFCNRKDTDPITGTAALLNSFVKIEKA